MKKKRLALRGLLLLFCIFTVTQSLFSKYYRKCKLFRGHHGREISEMEEERVPIYPEEFYIEPLIETRKPLEYKEIDYFYIQYIGAGGSGEVYLVEDLKTREPKVMKRFFSEQIDAFEEENFIMHRLNYSVEWTKDDLNGIPQQTDYEKDKNKHKQIPTIAIYPSKQSITLRDVQFFQHEAVSIFYKILLELQKTHRNSIIHHDFKMGNIMVNSLGMNFKLFQTQLIDWNLADFYYLGFQTNSRKGTTCYFSPEQLMRASHITPAIDVWALAVVMWTFFTDQKPFFTNCKINNLKAIASLVGIDALIKMHTKYRYPIIDEYYQLVQQHIKNPNKYTKKDLRNLVPEQRKQFFTDDLIEIFERMLTPDPEERITVSQLLKHRFFRSVKRIPPMYQQKRRAEENKKKKKS